LYGAHRATEWGCPKSMKDEFLINFRAYKNAKQHRFCAVNKLSLKVSPWGARDCGGNPFLRRGRKKDWSGKPGFLPLGQKTRIDFLDLLTPADFVKITKLLVFTEFRLPT
jgi:hypothetical protein